MSNGRTKRLLVCGNLCRAMCARRPALDATQVSEVTAGQTITLLSGLVLTAPKADVIILRTIVNYPDLYLATTRGSRKMEVARRGYVQKWKNYTGKISELPEAYRSQLEKRG